MGERGETIMCVTKKLQIEKYHKTAIRLVMSNLRAAHLSILLDVSHFLIVTSSDSENCSRANDTITSTQQSITACVLEFV